MWLLEITFFAFIASSSLHTAKPPSRWLLRKRRLQSVSDGGLTNPQHHRGPLCLHLFAYKIRHQGRIAGLYGGVKGGH